MTFLLGNILGDLSLVIHSTKYIVSNLPYWRGGRKDPTLTIILYGPGSQASEKRRKMILVIYLILLVNEKLFYVRLQQCITSGLVYGPNLMPECLTRRILDPAALN